MRTLLTATLIWIGVLSLGQTVSLAQQTSPSPIQSQSTQPAIGTPSSSPALMPEETRFSNDQLDSLVAPIALYPDPLLAQTLAASTYPLEVVALQQWMERNKN